MPVPVINLARMRAWEQSTWDSGQAVETVMRRAGNAVARTAMRLTKKGSHILILAGKGNNGGDARYAAEYMSDRIATLIDASDPTTALAALPRRSADLIIDGLFGIGLNRPLEDDWRRLIEAVNSLNRRVLAVDCPSGLNCDTGETMGDAVRASVTVTFGAPKVGLIHPDARELVGRIEVADDIGLVPCPANKGIQWILPADFDDFPPERPESGHKGTFGHLAIIAGSEGYHGAAVIAARASHRAMPGLVTLFTTPNAYQPLACQLQQAMVKPLSGSMALPPKCTALLVGPGLAGPDVGPALIHEIQELWAECPLPVIADASALDWLPQKKHPSAVRIITPHPGEAARMMDAEIENAADKRIQVASLLSSIFGDCHVVLKGSRTLIRHPGMTNYINSTGNPTLGQGGTGDALAGYLAGLVAQPRLRENLETVIRFAVWEHGNTADQLSADQSVWDMEDFIPRLGNSRRPA